MKELKFWLYNGDHPITAHAKIVDTLPETGDHVHFIYDDEIVTGLYLACIDPEQPRREVWKYDIYEVEITDANNEEDVDYIYLAVEKEEEEAE